MNHDEVSSSKQNDTIHCIISLSSGSNVDDDEDEDEDEDDDDHDLW